MSEFIKEYGTLFLAIYGIIQLWIIALWRKYGQRGRIETYETGKIELGYGIFGPTVGLNGTLRALNKGVFIKSIDLIVVREKDKSQHLFHWFAFRPPQVRLSGGEPISMEIPSGFLTTPDSPHRFNIVFCDSEFSEDIQTLFRAYISEWQKILEQLSKAYPSSLAEALATEEMPEQKNRLIDNFRKSHIFADTYAELNTKCYWEPGDYSLTIHVRASRPNRVFSKSYPFSITKSDSKHLKLNVIPILQEPISRYLRIQNYPYNYAYAAYK